ncbi:ABC transporter permease subunit [Kiloniella sp. b19]|uniref:ABC transporter permease subunit n=1 Tax=Kiloniella sp. GXU_MW_B19 TaxID=3141326 RepID=UPI0031D87B19
MSDHTQPLPPATAKQNWRKRLLIATPYFWLLLLFLAPFGIVLKISLSDTAIALPPYSPTFDWSDGFSGLLSLFRELDFENYLWLSEDPLYLNAYLSSLRIAATATLLTLLVGYPVAYAMARAPEQWRPALLMFMMLPFWTSFLIRVYAWIGILKNNGLLNFILMSAGITDEPLNILGTNVAVYIGIVYSYMPFMILPLYASLEKLDHTLLEAAADLGCPPWKSFWLITLPLTLPGIVAGCALVFIPSIGEFVIPDLLGGSETLMIGKVMWVEFFGNRDWTVASAVAVILLLILVVPIVLFQRHQEKRGEAFS